jgi:3-mercaptopyruvate sulfurtransferase SseA
MGGGEASDRYGLWAVFLARLMPFISKARNYDGSFHEWAGDPSLPLE